MSTRVNKKKIMMFFTIFVIAFAVISMTVTSIVKNITLGLDLKGGFEILYEVTPLHDDEKLDMSAVANSIRKRVDILGVSEPQIAIEGDDRIRVQLAGVHNPDSARAVLGTTANLTFRDINDTLLSDASIIQEGGASLGYDQSGKPIVSLKIKDHEKFAEITKKVSTMPSNQNLMVIWLDYEEGDSYTEEAKKAALGQSPKYISAAYVNSELTGDSMISGNFTEQEARTLAGLINSGSLPVKMTEISSNVVSADFGVDALNETARAGIIGILLVFAFMIVTYRVPGILATMMLIVYIYAIFLVYSLMGVVFTLPGIAALALGVGMTVDANIITFERIKDELYKGRSIKNAVQKGQNLSFSAIFDAQFTTLLAGIIMYMFGNGSVKGFAIMLIITVIATLLINVAISHSLLNLLVDSNILNDKPGWFNVRKDRIPNISKNEEQFYFGPFAKIDYIAIAKKYVIGIVVVFILGTILSILPGHIFNLGIDFSSGTKLTIISNETINIQDVEQQMADLGYTSGFKYQIAGENTVYALTSQTISVEELTTIKDVFKQKYRLEPNDNVVTPTVGKELVKNATMLTLLAWVVMMLYVTIRFKWDYAISCVVALLHDVFLVLLVFAVFKFEVNTELVSVILAIIGYSINNSIVVFDRIRELVDRRKGTISKGDYRKIANEAISNTITRSLYSSLTTILPVIVLLWIGSNAIFTFTFAMLCGLIFGTISSIFVSNYVWYIIRIHHKEKPKKVKKRFKEELDEYTIKGINA